jgi:iron complex outermembrane receptor protein
MKTKLFILSLFLGLTLQAQNLIKGTVSDASGVPLPGVNIVLKDTQIGTTTDFDGKYQIQAQMGQTLVFSILGFETKEIVVKGNTLNVALESKSESLNEITLTGSRNPNRSKLNTPVPVDVVPLSELKTAMPQTNVNDILNYLVPSFNSNRQSASDGTEHIDPASLRGLGPDQVLVLINGKRRHTTSLVNNQSTFGNGSVGTDLSAIPAAAIERVEVLRDGASAQYGSDAIAGVINIILKKDSGLEVNTTYGQTSRADGETIDVNLNYGAKLGEDGGFYNLTLGFNDRQKTTRSKNHNLIIFDQSEFGNFFAYDFSNPNAREIDDQKLAENGLDRDDFNFQVGDAAIRNLQGFLNLEYPVSENAVVYLSGGISVRDGQGFGFRRLPSETENVVPELFPFGFQPSLLSDISDQSLSTGVRFKLGQWNFDLSNTLGENIFDFTVENSNNFSLGANSPTKFDAGGHEFFQNTVNLDARKYYDYILNGLNVAVGSEFRYERYEITAGEEASFINGGVQSFPGFSPLNAVAENRTSVAFYLDLEAEVTDKFLIGLAGRYEDFSDFGNTFNGKLTARYELTNALALRGAVSTGFRAPSLHQQFFNNIATDIVDGELLNTGIFRNDSEVAKQLGIPELEEETSVSYSIGFTYKPLKNLSFTLDAYRIEIDDRVILTGSLGNDPFGDPVPELRDLFGQFGASTGRFFTNAVDTETNGLDLVVDYNTGLGNGKLTASLLYNINDNNVKDGINNLPAVFVGQEDVYFGPQEKSLIESNIPKHKAILNLNYAIGRFNFLVRNTYFGQVTRNGFPFGVSQKHDPRTVTDLSGTVKLFDGLQFTAGVNNVFDVFPDRQEYDNSFFGVFRYAPVQMGTTGAFYFARLTYKL